MKKETPNQTKASAILSHERLQVGLSAFLSSSLLAHLVLVSIPKVHTNLIPPKVVKTETRVSPNPPRGPSEQRRGIIKVIIKICESINGSLPFAPCGSPQAMGYAIAAYPLTLLSASIKAQLNVLESLASVLLVNEDRF